jgi:1-acyl-sn-glycerol-3-phosphate acyltransferase
MNARSRFLWTVSPPVVRGVGKAFFSLEVVREADLPPPPFVMASNHYSHLDPPAIGCALGHPIRFLALEDLFGVSRLLDWLVEGYGSIPTPRNRVPVAAVRTALAALENGESVCVFPEATRVSHWGTLAPKRGAAWLAVRAGVPLVPVAVIGTGQAMGLENRIQRAPIRVVFGEALAPGNDPAALTERWREWTAAQIGRYPQSEVSGPPRAYFGGS